MRAASSALVTEWWAIDRSALVTGGPVRQASTTTAGDDMTKPAHVDKSKVVAVLRAGC
jgi:hypothetical protein